MLGYSATSYAEDGLGYEVHITRAESWLDSESRPIELAEWIAFAEAAPDLTPDRQSRAGEAAFRLRVDGIETWLAWRAGEIYSKNPPRPVRARMYRVARALDARVQGDEGELYDESGEPIASADTQQPSMTLRSAFLGLIALAPVVLITNSPLLALASLVLLIAVTVLAFVLFDGLAAVAVAAAAALALLAWMALRAVAH
jgi:hypothetical protein